MQSQAEILATLSPSEQAEALADLTDAEKAALLYDWRGFLARPEQIAPDGDWDIWLLLAGRGFGKTRTGAEWVREQVDTNAAERIALVAETAADARDVMVAELLRIFPKHQRPVYTKSNRCVEFHNGAKAFTYNAVEPDQLRGPQHDCFIAGTLVATERGQIPIERVLVGERVWTRAGLRRVSATRKRVAEVGKVKFSNGVSLVGTGTHPIYTSNGWTRMSKLSKDIGSCVTLAYPGAASLGIGMEPAGDHITSAPINQGQRSGQSGFIGLFGRQKTAQFRAALKFITSITTRPTIKFQTLLAFLKASTAVNIGRTSPFRAWLGRINHFWMSSAQIAGLPLNDGGVARPFALSVRPNALKQIESTFANVQNAGQTSKQEPETIAVSVVSTWRPKGETSVYCLTVEDQPEYFANGVLVHNCGWLDEVAKWKYARETFDQFQFGLRLGVHPRQVITTTPRAIELIKSIVAGNEGKVHVTRGSTMDNASNLSTRFMERVQKRYAGTRLGRQELNAEILSDLPGALWTQTAIDAYRVFGEPELERILVAVDPAVTNTEESDEHGIIVAGLSDENEGHVIEDASLQGSPIDWARKTVEMVNKHGADGVVVEVNQGGDMVAHTLRTVSPNLNIIEVRASRGKHVRAEPVAALYEQGRIRHVGHYPELENQMTQFTNEGYQGSGSPDRTDALVWVMSELFPDMVETVPDASVHNMGRGGGAGFMAS